MEPIKTVKGTNGQLALYPDKLRISRKGALALFSQGLKGDKEIFLNQISSIQLKKAGLTNGYIQFAFLGGQETKSGLFGGIKDENTIVFSLTKNKEFEEMKSLIEEQIQKVRGGNSQSQAATGMQDLKELKKLKDEGVITDEEFKQKKKQLLGI